MNAIFTFNQLEIVLMLDILIFEINKQSTFENKKNILLGIYNTLIQAASFVIQEI